MNSYLAKMWLFALALVGCSENPPAKQEAHLSNEAVLQIANSAASHAGYDLSKWQPPEAHFEYVEHNRTWSVFYQSSGNTMPSHFLVVVSDETHSTSIFGGE